MSHRIKEIYDRLVPEDVTKPGAHYEILAAFVWKILDSSAAVVHDIDVQAPGHKTVQQIDVHVSRADGSRRRVVIECRDKEPEASSPKVDQDEARSFATVAAQLRRDPDDPLTEAIMVTTVGYTRGAENVASDEELVLAVLEPANVVREIHLEFHVSGMGVPEITAWLWRDEAERRRLVDLLGPKEYRFHQDTEEATFYDAEGGPTETYRAVLEPIFQELRLEVGTNQGRYEFDGIRYVELEPGVRAAVRGFEYRVSVEEGVWRTVITAARRADQIAELVLRSLDGSLPERMISAGELKGLQRGPDGVIRPRQ